MWHGDRLGPTWENEANCLDKPVTMFFLAELGEPEAAVIRAGDPQKYKKLAALNWRRMKRATEICRGCPVWDTCLETATDSDRTFSVRGGLMPYGFEQEKPIKPPKVRKPRPESGVAKTKGRRGASGGAAYAENNEILRQRKLANPCEKCGGFDWREFPRKGRKSTEIRCRVCQRASEKSGSV